ncbi:MAG: Rab family GTPase [Candidatus Thorarchaeota archaeon]
MKRNSSKGRRKKAVLKDNQSELRYEPFYKTLKTFHEEIPNNLENSDRLFLENTITEIFKGTYKAEPVKVGSIHQGRKSKHTQINKLSFKIDIIGRNGAGISTLVNNYSYTMFPESYMNTVGVDFYLKEFSFNGTGCIMQLWTHSNEERFKPLRSASLAGSNGVIIVYDLTDALSLEVIHEWIPLIRARAANIPIILLGNKLDLNNNRQVKKDDIKQLTKKYNIPLSFEISAITGFNVDYTFTKLLLSILEQGIGQPSPQSTKISQTTFEKIDSLSKAYPKKRSKKKGY